MAINKIVLNTEDGEQVLVDLTGDTVTAETLAEGVTAHDKSGAKITGTMTGGGEDLEAVLTEQESLIAELQDTLRGKAAGGGAGTTEIWTLTLEDGTEITKEVVIA